jgi:hypothetical protein
VAALQESVVQGFLSSQSAAVVQQLGTTVVVHCCCATLQLDCRQVVELGHCELCVQHPETGLELHVCVPSKQVSTVQGFPSLQSVSARQQPATAVCVHWPEALQASVVHRLPSSQPAAEVQQLAMGVLVHLLAAQVSVVQTLLSLQLAVVQPATAAPNS